MINDIDKELNNEILWRYKELKNISRLFEKHTKKELIILELYKKKEFLILRIKIYFKKCYSYNLCSLGRFF